MNQIVVTGMGAVSPFGEGVKVFLDGLKTGRTTERPSVFSVADYRVQDVYHAQLSGTSPGDRYFPEALADRALLEALTQAGANPSGEFRCGLALASTSAGWHLPDEALDPCRPPLDPQHDVAALMKEGPALALAERRHLDGPQCTLSSACASSTGAIAWATERIRRGEVPMMAVGAVDIITEVVFAGFHAMRLLSSQTRPFDPHHPGFVLAEGAAFLILEDAEHARNRGAGPLATIAGWGGSSDASHMTTPSSDGIARSLRAALADALYAPEEVAAYHAHGTGSAASDTAETEAVTQVLNERTHPLQVTAIKSGCGHTEGAAGLFSMIAAVDIAGGGPVPPVLGVPRSALPGQLPQDASTSTAPGPALVHASGFGGVNCTVLVDRPEKACSAVAPTGRAGHTVVRLAARATAPDKVSTIRFAEAPAERGQPPEPDWRRALQPDRVTRLLGHAIGAVLGLAGPELSGRLRADGLLTGTAYGAQAHHGRMYETIRTLGGRSVDPLDFARSTFNTPASQCAIIHGVTGRVESFVGATAGVEALLTGADLITAGRARSVLAAGCDAPENRLWRTSGDPSVPDAATVLVLDDASEGTEDGAIELVGHRRLAPTSRGRTTEALRAAVDQLDRRSRAELVWLDRAGLTPQEESTLVAAMARPCRVVESLAGAASPLDQHIDALTSLMEGEVSSVTVITTARHAPATVVRYERMSHG